MRKAQKCARRPHQATGAIKMDILVRRVVGVTPVVMCRLRDP